MKPKTQTYVVGAVVTTVATVVVGLLFGSDIRAMLAGSQPDSVINIELPQSDQNANIVKQEIDVPAVASSPKTELPTKTETVALIQAETPDVSVLVKPDVTVTPLATEVSNDTKQILQAVTLPTFDVVRIEPSGEGVLAGRSEPEWQLQLRAGKDILGSSISTTTGEWVVILDSPLSEGTTEIRAWGVSKDGKREAASEQSVIVSVSSNGELLVVMNHPDKPTEIVSIEVEKPAEIVSQLEPVKQVAALQAPGVPEIKKPAVTQPIVSIAKTPESVLPEIVVPEVIVKSAPVPADIEIKQPLPVVVVEVDEPSTPLVVAPPVQVSQTKSEPVVVQAPAAAVVVETVVPAIVETVPVINTLVDAKTTKIASSDIVIASVDKTNSTGVPKEALTIAPDKTVVVSPAVVAPAIIETPPLVVVPKVKPAPVQLAVVAPASEIAPKVVKPVVVITPVVSVDAVEIDEKTKSLYVAGSAVPVGAEIRIYVDDKYIGSAKTNSSGRWLLQVQGDLDPGKHRIRADHVDPSSGTVFARAEVPFVREAGNEFLKPVKLAARGSGEAAQGGTGAATILDPKNVIIRRGDNLWTISRRLYGAGIRYTTIYQANTDQIQNPNLIFPGQLFVLPQANPGWIPKG
ncbi:MAG: hypothetical protein COB90_05485 [Hyphomicrobiales bacterium]|nr:MAG: hypothetical protein COB90_05485 [Hyphomicrobiales bacterium]